MKMINIELTDAEYKALEYVSYSPEEYANNVVKSRAAIGIEEIYSIEIVNDPTLISLDKTTVVNNSNILNARERDEINNKELQDKINNGE